MEWLKEEKKERKMGGTWEGTVIEKKKVCGGFKGNGLWGLWGA